MTIAEGRVTRAKHIDLFKRTGCFLYFSLDACLKYTAQRQQAYNPVFTSP